MQKPEQPVVIQFIHPSPEDCGGNDKIKSWNGKKHKRNFIVSAGRFVKSQWGNLQRSKNITFWGEWEPEAKVDHNFEPKGGSPRRRIAPLFPKRVSSKSIAGGCGKSSCVSSCGGKTNYNNTDPFVFGRCFKYSNCRQYTNKGKSKTIMQNLPLGSMILFGSCIKQENKYVFVLDTVLVVGKIKKFSTDKLGEVKQVLQKDYSLFEAATLGLLKEGTNPPKEYTLYLGQCYAKNKIYSFVPCDAEGKPFAKVSLTQKDIPELSMRLETFKVLKDKRNKFLDPQEIWKVVATKVLLQGRSLGVSFDNVKPNVRRTGRK